MAKTRRKNNVRTPVKGRKSNVTIAKQSPIISHKRGAKGRVQKSKTRNIKTMLYESPLKHLYHNGEQSNAQSQREDTKVKELVNLSENDENLIEANPNTNAESVSIVNKVEKVESESVVNKDEKEADNSANVSLKSKRDDSEPADLNAAPVKKRKLNKSPLSRLNAIDEPTSTSSYANKIQNIDESVICVDDLDVASPSASNTQPPVISEDVVVLDETTTFPQLGSSNPLHNLTDSIIVLDDEPQSLPHQTSEPSEDCMVVWSTLPTTLTSPTTSKNNLDDLLKSDKILLDTNGESSNLKYLKNDSSNKKFAKKSPKVTKFGVKKLNAKKVSEITKGLAKTKIVTKAVPKVTKTPVKKKSKGDLIFAAQSSGSKTKDTSNEKKPKKGTLREIVIDGSNVAMACTNNKVFSEKGIKMLIDYFTKKGHTVKVFVPQYRRARHYPLLEKWHDEGIVVFTPSRKVGNKCITSYDDRFIIEYATTCKGIVVSQDQFRDLYAEKAEYKDTIENRLLMPTFVGDYVMFPEDPLGRNGPSLSEFLKH